MTTGMAQLSKHAARRARQRGIRCAVISAILDHADVEVPIGDGCRRVPKRTAAAMRLNDEIAHLGVIWSDSRAQIVTVLPICRGRRGARYRGRH